MFEHIENITQRALKALEAARVAATDAQHNYIEPAHLLIGLAQTQGSLAATVLHELGIEAGTLRTTLQQALPSQGNQHPVQPSADFQKLLAIAQMAAQRQGDDFLATEHLLLGLVEQQTPLVVLMLAQHQVRVENVRYSIQHLLAEADASQPVRPPQMSGLAATQPAPAAALPQAAPAGGLWAALRNLWRRIVR